MICTDNTIGQLSSKDQNPKQFTITDIKSNFHSMHSKAWINGVCLKTSNARLANALEENNDFLKQYDYRE